MKGRVYDGLKNEAMSGVIIHNIFTDELVYSDDSGRFEIPAKKGELVEFKMLGYKVSRIRLHTDPANYYQIGLILGPIELEEFTVYNRDPDRRVDSIKTAEVFNRAINMRRFEGMDALKHPFSALSKENRRIWAFQDRYYKTEKEKYIEYVFNEKLIQKLTDLGKDSIQDYRNRFRPHYADLTVWNEYEYYNYIKETVETYRRNKRYYID